jgi:stage II sporulation protein R
VRRKAIGLVCICLGIALMGCGWLLIPAQATQTTLLQSQVIRLHVIANSDSDADQALKRAVRDAILAEVTPLFTAATTRDEARTAILAASPQITAAARRVIATSGSTYPIRLELGRASFPGKAYGAVYLPAGDYEALKVMIGSGQGANWWCVLFPPMCFLDWATGVVEEPKPGTNGQQTVTVHRRVALLDEESLKTARVEAHFAFLDWFRGWRAKSTQ